MTSGGEFLIYEGAHTPTVTSAKINMVKAGHSYKYRVIAINRVGLSDISPFSDVIVASSVPARPDQPRLVSTTSSSITLEFDKVEDNGGSSVSSYNLYIDRGDENSHDF